MSSIFSERFADTNKEYSKDPRPYYEPNLHTGRRVPKPFSEVLTLLDEERQNNKLYNEIWKKAEKKFALKKQELGSDYFRAGIADECYIAVIAYTMGLEKVSVNGEYGQLYEDFNREFRTLRGKGSWEYFRYKSFYYLLKAARHGISNQSFPRRRLYREIRNVYLSPEPRIGDDFYFHFFSSCSEDYNFAKGFLGEKGTMIELVAGADLAINIAPYSVFDNSYEVLVFPHNKFKVAKFWKDGNIDNIIIKRDVFDGDLYFAETGRTGHPNLFEHYYY